MGQGFSMRAQHKLLFPEFLRISVPIILTNLMGASLHIIDNIMVGSLGDLELASVAQANQLTFILRVALFGAASGCMIFASQHWGDNDLPGVRRTMGISLLFAFFAGLAFFAAGSFFPNAVMSVYTTDADAAALGARYLQIVSPTYPIIAISTILNAINRSTERVKLNMAAAGLAILTNAALNYCLIFGHFGFPRMGVEGAALATAIAACVEALVMIFWIYFKKYPSAARMHELVPRSFQYVKRYFKVALPVFLNEGIWSLGISAYAAIYGRVSIQAVAAMNVVNTVEQVVLAAIWGVMNATAVMVGKRIGARQEQQAFACARYMMRASLIIGVLMGGVVLLSRFSILGFFNISDEAKTIAMGVLLASAFVMWMRSFNSVNVVGILRSGGDAVYAMILDSGTVWAIGVPVAYVASIYFALPLPYVYLLIHLEAAVKIAIGYRRFRSGKWLNNLVDGEKKLVEKDAKKDALPVNV